MAEGSISRRSLLVGGAVTVGAGIAGFFVFVAAILRVALGRVVVMKMKKPL